MKTRNSSSALLKFSPVKVLAGHRLGFHSRWHEAPTVLPPNCTTLGFTKLVQEYDDSLYLKSDYKAAKGIANEDAIKVRGLVRLSFTEIVFGKRGNKWKKNLKTCESLLSENATIEHAEYLLYLGAIRGKWQSKFAERLGHLNKSILIANRIGDDRTLAIAYMHASELYAYLDQTELVTRNAYHGVTVAKHYGQQSIQTRTLRNLIFPSSDS